MFQAPLTIDASFPHAGNSAFCQPGTAADNQQLTTTGSTRSCPVVTITIMAQFFSRSPIMHYRASIDAVERPIGCHHLKFFLRHPTSFSHLCRYSDLARQAAFISNTIKIAGCPATRWFDPLLPMAPVGLGAAVCRPRNTAFPPNTSWQRTLSLQMADRFNSWFDHPGTVSAES
jgi:hypothetical protein